MSIPFFYEAQLPATPGLFTLSEESSKHCSIVLRMKTGSIIALTNGLGLKCLGEIVAADKKKDSSSIVCF
jgi:16S rRNA (uracil1498-N3)-methyltransferase